MEKLFVVMPSENLFKKAENLIIASNPIRFSILTALSYRDRNFREKQITIKDFADILEEKNEQKIQSNVDVLLSATLIKQEKIDLFGRSIWNCFFLTDEGNLLLKDIID